jgi:hypothetical protein
MLAHGKLGKDAALIWFLHTPWRWCFWRWPKIERMGQFGRYTYRWRIGPLDGKWRPAYPQHLRLYDTWCSYRLEAAAWRWAVQIDLWYQPRWRVTLRVARQRRIEL